MLTKEERQEIINDFFYYSALAIREAKKLEANSKPKRVSKIQASSNKVVSRRRERRLK